MSLHAVKPVSTLTVVHKGAFNVDCGGPLHKFVPFRGAKVPHGLHILVLQQVFGQMIPVTRYDVNNTAR